MTLQSFHLAKILVTAVLAALISIAVVQRNYLLAVAALAIAILLKYILRRQVNEVIEDERDYEAAGKAARLSISAFSVLAAVATFALLYFRDQNPFYEVVGSVLAYSVCALLIFYSLVFKYYDGGVSAKSKALYTALAVLFVLGFAVAGARLFTPEDTWICEKGSWVEHGHPSAPMPTAPCK